MERYRSRPIHEIYADLLANKVVSDQERELILQGVPAYTGVPVHVELTRRQSAKILESTREYEPIDPAEHILATVIEEQEKAFAAFAGFLRRRSNEAATDATVAMELECVLQLVEHNNLNPLKNDLMRNRIEPYTNAFDPRLKARWKKEMDQGHFSLTTARISSAHPLINKHRFVSSFNPLLRLVRMPELWHQASIAQMLVQLHEFKHVANVPKIAMHLGSDVDRYFDFCTVHANDTGHRAFLDDEVSANGLQAEGFLLVMAEATRAKFWKKEEVPLQELAEQLGIECAGYEPFLRMLRRVLVAYIACGGYEKIDSNFVDEIYRMNFRSNDQSFAFDQNNPGKGLLVST